MAKQSLVGNLIVRLGADSTNLDTNLEKSRKRINKFAKNSRRQLNRAGEAFVNFGRTGSIALAGVTAAAATMSYQMGRTQAQMENFASANGTAVNEIEKLQFALEKVGSETSAQDVIKDLNDRVGDLRLNNSGPLIDIIDRMSVSAEQLALMNPQQQLNEIARAINDLPTSSQINVLESLSGDASELLPLLRDGGELLNQFSAEAENLGAVTSGKLRAGLIQSYQNMTDLKTSVQATARIITSELSPYIGQLSDDLTDATNDTQEFGGEFTKTFEQAIRYGAKVADVINGLVVTFQGGRAVATNFVGSLIIGFENLIKKGFEAAASITEVVESIADGYNRIPGLPDIDTSGIQSQLSYYRQEIKNTADETQKWRERIDAANDAFNDAVMRQTPSSAVEEWLERVRQRANETEKAVSDAATGGGSGNLIENWTNGNGSGAPARAGNGSGQSGVGPGHTTVTVPETPQVMSQAESDMGKIDQMSGMLEQYDSVERKIKRINDSYRQNVELINRAARRGQISSKQQSRMLENLAKKRDQEIERFQKNTNQMTEFSRQASRNIQNQLGDTIEKTLNGNFDGILKGWVDMLKKMSIQSASSNILGGLFGKGQGSGGGLLGDLFGGSGGSGGGIMSSLQGMFGGGSGGSGGGGFMSSLQGMFGGGGGAAAGIGGGIGTALGGAIAGMLADGGPAQAGKNYIVGEEGPEIFSPSRSGTVIPNDAISSGGGGNARSSSVNVTVVNQGGSNLEVTGKERKRNSNGSEEVKVMVRQAVSEMSSTGELEEAMGSYNMQRKQTTA